MKWGQAPIPQQMGSDLIRPRGTNKLGAMRSDPICPRSGELGPVPISFPEARATLREQSGSTLERRVRRPSGPSPFASKSGMSPLRFQSQQEVAILLVAGQRLFQRTLEIRIPLARDLRAVQRHGVLVER